MKTMNFKSMMIIGMMMLCTTTSFGKTTIVKNTCTHVTVVKKQTPDKDCHCKNCEDMRKKQQKKTVSYCDYKNCSKKKKDGKKCKVTKKGQKCTCKPQPVKPQNHPGGKPMRM